MLVKKKSGTKFWFLTHSKVAICGFLKFSHFLSRCGKTPYFWGGTHSKINKTGCLLVSKMQRDHRFGFSGGTPAVAHVPKAPKEHTGDNCENDHNSDQHKQIQ